MIPRSWCLLSRSLKWVSSWLPRYLFWHFRWGTRFSREDNGDTLVVEGGEGSSPYLLRVKSFILTMLELLLTFSPLFVLLSILYLRTVLVLLISLAMLTRSSVPLIKGQWQQYWLFRNRWVPISGNRPWRSEGDTIQFATSVSSQYVSSVLLRAPYTAKLVMLELTGGQVISALNWYHDRDDEDIWRWFYSKDWLCIYVQPRWDVCSLVEPSCYDQLTWLVEFAFWPR